MFFFNRPSMAQASLTTYSLHPKLPFQIALALKLGAIRWLSVFLTYVGGKVRSSRLLPTLAACIVQCLSPFVSFCPLGEAPFFLLTRGKG